MIPTENRTSPHTTTGLRRGATAVAAAVVTAALLWAVAVPLLAIPLQAQGPPGTPPLTIGLPMVIIGTLVPALAGWGLLALLQRVTARARTVWTVIAVAVLALSMLPVLGATSTGALVVLGLMHLAVGAVLIALLTRTGPAAPTR